MFGEENECEIPLTIHSVVDKYEIHYCSFIKEFLPLQKMQKNIHFSLWIVALVLFFFFSLEQINKQFSEKCVFPKCANHYTDDSAVWLPLLISLYLCAGLKKHLNTKQHCFGEREEKKINTFLLLYFIFATLW